MRVSKLYLGVGVLKKLNIVILFLVGIGLILGTVSQQNADATVSGTNILVSYDAANTGPSSGGTSQIAHISDDGNVVAWTSKASDVVTGFNAAFKQSIYVRDLQNGAALAANIDLSGASAEVRSDKFAISMTGRYVSFSSNSTNLVASPSVLGGGYNHIYLRDTLLNVTQLVDQTSSGVPAVGYGTGSAQPWPIAVSDDGRYVTFGSAATNLLAANNPSSPNYTWYYYVKDMQTGQVINPLVSNSGVRSNSTSGAFLTSCDGSIGTFTAGATNLTPNDNGNYNTYVVDMRNGYSISNLTYATNQGAIPVSISCNGRYIILYSISTNITSDIVNGTVGHLFRYDRLKGTYELIDKSNSGYISSSYAPDDGPSGSRTVSDDGLVVFAHRDHNMVSPAASKDWEIYVRNPEAGTTEMVPVSTSGAEQNATPIRGSLDISARGGYVVYSSKATNIVPTVTSTTLFIVRSKI